MTARLIRVSGAMAAQPTAADHQPAQRGDGGRGDALIALGEAIGTHLDRALILLVVFGGGYFAGHLGLAALRVLL